MESRINYAKYSPELNNKLFEFSMAVSKCSLDKTLTDLVHIYASQLNGCTFCLDMHVKEAKIHGERELRLYHLPVWRESTLFSEKERAVLEWTEATTKLTGHGISDEIFKRVSEHLSEKEMSELVFVIGLINFWNRYNICSPRAAGLYDTMFGLDKAGLV